MDKSQIIAEIQRTARANGGVALGWRRFADVTGIKYHDWYGRWARWGDAVREAGFEPNRMAEAYDEGALIEMLALLTRRLGRVPAHADLLLATKTDPDLPSEKVFRKLGSKSERATRIVAFCEATPGFEDVSALWRSLATPSEPSDAEGAVAAPDSVGFVVSPR